MATDLKIEELRKKPKNEMNEYEVDQIEQYEFSHGPLSLIQTAIRSHQPVLISCRNNRKLLARVKAFDRHCNMVLENAKEIWQEAPKLADGSRGKPVNKDRFINLTHVEGYVKHFSEESNQNMDSVSISTDRL